MCIMFCIAGSTSRCQIALIPLGPHEQVQPPTHLDLDITPSRIGCDGRDDGRTVDWILDPNL